MGIEGQATGLQRTLMSWDYWSLAEKLGDGGGVVDTLRHVPKSFSSVEVPGALTVTTLSSTGHTSGIRCYPAPNHVFE